MLPLKSPFPIKQTKGETISKQPEPNSKLQKGKQKETGNNNLLISVNVKTFKPTQKVHGTPFSNLLKALMDTTICTNQNILQMNKVKLQQLTRKTLTSLATTTAKSLIEMLHMIQL